jgi:hypothetical protein
MCRALIAQAGIPVDDNVKPVSIGSEIVALPQTDEAARVLRNRNWLPVPITPAVGGFIADAQSADIVRAVIEKAAQAAAP